jgi:hypothetical protein
MQSSVPSALPCCRQAVAIRYNTMLRGSALSRRLVGDQQRYGRSWHTLDAGSEPLVGGRRRVAWYVTQAADRQAMMLAMVDVAVGTCG